MPRARACNSEVILSDWAVDNRLPPVAEGHNIAEHGSCLHQPLHDITGGRFARQFRHYSVLCVVLATRPSFGQWMATFLQPGQRVGSRAMLDPHLGG